MCGRGFGIIDYRRCDDADYTAISTAVNCRLSIQSIEWREFPTSNARSNGDSEADADADAEHLET